MGGGTEDEWFVAVMALFTQRLRMFWSISFDHPPERRQYVADQS